MLDFFFWGVHLFILHKDIELVKEAEGKSITKKGLF
jgi:hypothetical protein